MRCLFTIHAGEYLVGSHIEKAFKGYNVWIPSKDTGVDLLITNSSNKKTVSLQVKFSKDYGMTNVKDKLAAKFKTRGWFSINRSKLAKSKADYWVFVLFGYDKKLRRKIQYVIISPNDLHKRLTAVHGRQTKINCYLTVAADDKCWETRGLNRPEMALIAGGEYSDRMRNYTRYLEDWGAIRSRLK